MEIACLDLEGVLVPEIWIAFAEKTGIESLRATTRDIPDYDVLMKQRLRILDEHGLKLSDIQEVIGTLKPLDGAVEFIDWLRERFQVVILSDTFYEFSQPLMRQERSAWRSNRANCSFVTGDGSGACSASGARSAAATGSRPRWR